MDRISELTPLVPVSRELHQVDARLKEVTATRDAAMSKLQQSDKLVDAATAAIEAERQALAAARGGGAAALAAAPSASLNAEKQEVRQEGWRRGGTEAGAQARG